MSMPARIVINEWLPDPIGADAKGEWVELYNASDLSVSLAGWRMSTGAKKPVALHGVVQPHDYLLLQRPGIKIVLRNRAGELFLYDEHGTLVDSAVFVGTAPEGKSYTRGASGFGFTQPTPGAANQQAPVASIIQSFDTPMTQSIHSPFSFLPFIALGFFVSLLLAVCAIVLVRADEQLSQLFFGRH